MKRTGAETDHKPTGPGPQAPKNLGWTFSLIIVASYGGGSTFAFDSCIRRRGSLSNDSGHVFTDLLLSSRPTRLSMSSRLTFL